MQSTFENIVERYIRVRNLTEGTRSEYIATARKWNAWNGVSMIQDLDKRTVREFLEWVHEHAIEKGGKNPGRTTNKARAHLRATHYLEGERKTIKVGGVEIELVSSPGETNDQLFVWYPKGKVLFAGDNFYRSFPNLYAIRGTPNRSVRVWAESLGKLADKDAVALVGGHTNPIQGANEVKQVLADYRDAVQFIHDKIRKVDFRCGKRLGKDDQIVSWPKRYPRRREDRAFAATRRESKALRQLQHQP